MLNSFPTIHGGPRRRWSAFLARRPTCAPSRPAARSIHAAHWRLRLCDRVIPPLRQPTPESDRTAVACHLYDPALLSDASLTTTSSRPASGCLPGSGKGKAAMTQSQAEQTSVPLTTPTPERRFSRPADLRKYFPVRNRNLFGPRPVVHAVEDTSLALYPGRALALVGESGSGKTTVARMLAQLYPPTSGTHPVRGAAGQERERASALLDYRRHVQMIFQDPFSSLNPIHDVHYHLGRPLRVHGTPARRQEREQVLALLETVSLRPAEQFIEQVSAPIERRSAAAGGHRPRVGRRPECLAGG